MEFKNIEEFEREKRLYVKLPMLIREIIYESLIPLPTCKLIVEKEIQEIKKITNAECESALEYLKKNNQSFME